MSGMFDQKSDKASRKLARTQKELKEKKKKRTIMITVIAVLVVITAISVVANSNFIRRTLPVLTIDGVSFTTAEFEYFFNSEYMEYVNLMQQFGMMGGAMPDPNRPLSSQVFDPDTGQTWADFIIELTVERLTGLVRIYNAATASGFTLPDEWISDIDNEVAMMEMQAMFSGFPSTQSFLQHLFGVGMNERVYRSVLEFIALINAYNAHVRESFNYSAEALRSYYNDNRDELDVFSYRQFTIHIERPDPEDFENDEDFEIALADASKEAYALAVSIAEGIENEDDFIFAAMDYSELYSEPDSTLRTTAGGRLAIDMSEWLLDESRDFGDITVIESNQGSNIIFFLSRDDNSYRTVGMRQILILRDQVDPFEFALGVDDPEYIASSEQAELEARERAEHVYALFIAAGGTEEALIELMDEHSDDTTPGGFYDNITMFPYQSAHLNTMRVVPELEAWLFDENRTIGDSELIYTSAFGYHLMFFTGFGEPFFELIAEDRMRTRDHSAWLDELPVGEPVWHFAFILVHV